MKETLRHILGNVLLVGAACVLAGGNACSPRQLSAPFPSSDVDPLGSGQSAEDEDWEEEWEENPPRSFLYREVVLSGFYSSQGTIGIPPGDMGRDHFELSPRPPGNYIAFDYVGLFPPSQGAHVLMPIRAINLHPRLVLDRMEEEEGFSRVKFAPQDFWVRFNPGGDRFTVRLGQFVIPYGVNPILAPRQRFILPLEGTDLGLKWDWGVNAKGPIGKYDWEAAITMGSGEALHAPYLFENSDSTSYLFTGRIGAPTYWDLQYGFSFLYGNLPFIRAAKQFSPIAISRWRVGFDSFYKSGTYLMLAAQVTLGQDGFAGDERFVGITMGETADVLGYRVMADWVIPEIQDLRLAAQYESVIRDLGTSGTDDTALIFEITYSLNTSLSFVLDHRLELNRSMGEESDAIYLTAVYYTR